MSAHIQAGPVEQGVPLPARGRNSPRASILAALLSMGPGESRLIKAPPGMNVVKLQNQVCAAWHDLPGTFTSKQDTHGVRVWRIK